jgi:hypothetical protein
MTDQNQLLRDALEAYEHAIANGHREHDALSAFSGISIPELARAAISHPAQPAPAQPQGAVSDDELPGLWSNADFSGGATDTTCPAGLEHYSKFLDAQPQGAGEAVGHIARFFSDVEALIEFSPHQGGSLRVGDKLYTTPPASQQAAQAVPEGWQLVPIEPTPIMVEAMVQEADRQESMWRYDGAAFCRAMLRAAKGEQ